MPVLEFLIDEQFKGTLRTYAIIHQAMQEIREKEEAAAAPAGEEGDLDNRRPIPRPPARTKTSMKNSTKYAAKIKKLLRGQGRQGPRTGGPRSPDDAGRAGAGHQRPPR